MAYVCYVRAPRPGAHFMTNAYAKEEAAKRLTMRRVLAERTSERDAPAFFLIRIFLRTKDQRSLSPR